MSDITATQPQGSMAAIRTKAFFMWPISGDSREPGKVTVEHYTMESPGGTTEGIKLRLPDDSEWFVEDAVVERTLARVRASREFYKNH